MQLHNDFKTIPHGVFLIRMFHERIGAHVFHAKLKVNDGEWFNQVDCPVFSSTMYVDYYADFWAWAIENMPIFDYKEVIKSAL